MQQTITIDELAQYSIMFKYLVNKEEYKEYIKLVTNSANEMMQRFCVKNHYTNLNKLLCIKIIFYLMKNSNPLDLINKLGVSNNE